MEYPVLIFMVTQLLLEQAGRNGSIHSNYLLVARELQTQQKRNLFFCVFYYYFPPACQPGERENVYTVAIEQLDHYIYSPVVFPLKGIFSE